MSGTNSFLNWIHSWQRLPNTLPPILWRASYIAHPLLFSNIGHPLPSAPTSAATVFFVFLFLWLNGWSCHIWCAILLNDIMDLHFRAWRILLIVSAWVLIPPSKPQPSNFFCLPSTEKVSPDRQKADDSDNSSLLHMFNNNTSTDFRTAWNTS